MKLSMSHILTTFISFVLVISGQDFKIECPEHPSMMQDEHSHQQCEFDVQIPSQSHNTMAVSCLKNLTKYGPSSCQKMKAVASRITLVLGVVLVGEPVAHGYSIATSQLQSLSVVGLLCKGCAKVHVTITHTKTSPIIIPDSQFSTSILSEDNNSNNNNNNNEEGNHDNNLKTTMMTTLKSGKEAIASLVDLLDKLSGGEATHRLIEGNQWEYPGILDIHKLAQTEMDLKWNDKNDEEEEKKKKKFNINVKTRPHQCGAINHLSNNRLEPIYLYFHNKGSSHISDGSISNDLKVVKSRFKDFDNLQGGFGRRTLYEMALFHEVVAPWKEILILFDMFGDKVQHSGIAPAQVKHTYMY
jgi:hypothetical protein